MKRRHRRTSVGQPRVAQRAPGLANWRPLNDLIDTARARNVDWINNNCVLVLEIPSTVAEGNWDRYFIRCQRPYDTANCQLIGVNRNVMPGR